MATIFTPSSAKEGLPAGTARVAGRAVFLLRTYPRESLGIGLFVLIAVAALISSLLSAPTAPGQVRTLPPAPPAMIDRPIAPAQALKVNSQIPVSESPNPSAKAFVFKGNAASRAQALDCLASAIYYEAGNQDTDGERAVAQVVLNRVRHPAFPSSICSVVFEGSTKATGCQFTFTCDGSLNRQPDTEGWKRAVEVADAALDGYVFSPVGWATHYHADYVVPYWASTMAKNAVVGAHLFYRWAGAWGQPGVFTRSYGGHEPSASLLRKAALAVPHVIPVYGGGQLAQALKSIPGAEPLKLSPSLRRDKRVAVRFNLVARKASDAVKPEDYSKQFAVSDNLKWSLSSESVAQNEQPLGRRSPPANPTAGETGQR